MHFVLIFGSVRAERRGFSVARFVERQLAARGHEVTIVDPGEYQLPLLDRMYKQYPKGAAPEVLEKLAAIYRRADAFVIVSGEYNHSIPAALKNLLDHFMEEYFWRPAAIVSYSAGAFGGVRAAVTLRPILGELGMVSIPSMFPVPSVQEAFQADGTPKDQLFERRFQKFAGELEWYAAALKEARAKGMPY